MSKEITLENMHILTREVLVEKLNKEFIIQHYSQWKKHFKLQIIKKIIQQIRNSFKLQMIKKIIQLIKHNKILFKIRINQIYKFKI